MPLRADDADELQALLDDDALHAYTGGEPLGPEAMRERCRRLEAGAPPDSGEAWGNWVVRRRADGVAVGTVQATLRGGEAVLAWVVGTRWQRRGYAGEAAAAMARRLREDGYAPSAHIHPGHAASQAVARRLGLAPTGAHDADGEERWA